MGEYITYISVLHLYIRPPNWYIAYILSTSQFLKSLYQVLCKNTAFMGCTVPSKKSIYHLYIRPTNRYIAYISSKHRCIPLNIIYTSLLISPYQELFKNIAFHANPGKRTLLKGGGGALSRMISGPFILNYRLFFVILYFQTISWKFSFFGSGCDWGMKGPKTQ